MPLLPWKTAMASRISRIVADLQSPKRGGSLVVETGFPTSVVDLFVKHRDRLRKHSARRKSKKKKKSVTEIHDSIALLSSSSPNSPPPRIYPTASAGGCLRCGNLEIDDLEFLDEARVVGDRGCQSVRNRTETCVVGGGAAAGNGVCMVAVKMFVVAVLALSTKKLVVGITLSASLLLVVEFFCKRAVFFLKPCANGEAALRSLIHKVPMHLWIGRNNPVVQNSENREEESIPKVSRGRDQDDFPNESIELCSSIEEIQLVEMPDGIEDETHYIGFLGDENENKDGAEIPVCGNQRGTRGRLNWRMFEKLVRKKSVRSDGFNHLEADIAQVNEEEDENLEQEQEQERDREINPPGFDEWQALEVAESHKIQEIERERSLNYPILVVVVLAGLFGGRILAVVLTTAGCFMIKLNEISRRRSLDPPLKVCC